MSGNLNVPENLNLANEAVNSAKDKLRVGTLRSCCKVQVQVCVSEVRIFSDRQHDSMFGTSAHDEAA
jgi:hypothetical protein